MLSRLRELRVEGISQLEWLLCASFAAVACWFILPLPLLRGFAGRMSAGEDLEGLPGAALDSAVATAGYVFFLVYIWPFETLARLFLKVIGADMPRDDD